MNLIAITIACVVLVVGAYVGKKEITNVAETQISQTQEEGVLSTEVETTEGDASVSIEVNNALGEETPTVTSTVTPSLSPSPTTQAPTDTSLNSYVYPGSTVIARTSTTLTLNGGSDTDAITNWYKDKIRQEGMNVKTFVTTKANDKVLNKLVGASSQKELSIEIKKEPGQNTSVIDVKVTSK